MRLVQIIIRNTVVCVFRSNESIRGQMIEFLVLRKSQSWRKTFPDNRKKNNYVKYEHLTWFTSMTFKFPESVFKKRHFFLQGITCICIRSLVTSDNKRRE